MSAPTPIPVLLYHHVGDSPSAWIAAFSVTAATLRAHLLEIEESGRTPISVADLTAGLRGEAPLPPRPVTITFDDGFVDTLTVAAPLLAEHGIHATLFATSGFIGCRSPGGDRMLSWAGLAELAAAGHEIGAHSVTHPQLDTLPPSAVRLEVRASKSALEHRLGRPVRSFAYPHGYSSRAVRREVAAAGYASACSVKNAFASTADPPFAVSRLMVGHDTDVSTVRGWLGGGGAPVGRSDERLLTLGWRGVRRLRSGPARGAA